MGSRSRSTSPWSRDAVAVREERRRRRAERRGRERGARWRSWASSIRVDDLVVFAVVSVLSVVGWIEFTLGADGDVGGGPATAAGAAALGSLVLFSRRYYQRTRHPDDEHARAIHLPLLFLPALTTPLVLVAITPPGASTEGFEPWVSVYPLIAAVALLMFAGVLVGLLVFGLVVWPLLLLVDAVRPPAAGGGVSWLARTVSRGELAGVAVALLATIGWAVSMALVYPDAQGTRAQRRVDTFLAWVSFRGEAVPSVCALLFLAVVAAAVAVGVRARRRRELAPRES